jgi:hypothetical protein
MLREDAAGVDDTRALVSDLNRLLEAASRFLERIDSLVSFSLPMLRRRRRMPNRRWTRLRHGRTLRSGSAGDFSPALLAQL